MALASSQDSLACTAPSPQGPSTGPEDAPTEDAADSEDAADVDPDADDATVLADDPDGVEDDGLADDANDAPALLESARLDTLLVEDGPLAAEEPTDVPDELDPADTPELLVLPEEDVVQAPREPAHSAAPRPRMAARWGR